jgi:molybdopterin-guanine dinucleotide biosynthesis protein A
LTAAGEALLQAYRVFRADVEDYAQATFCRHFADGAGLRAPERQRAEVWLRRPVFAGVLVGGASTRMGRSKSMLRFEGMTFAERVVAAVRERVERIVLLGDGPAPSMPPDVIRLPDVPGLGGPLAGILAGLRWAGEVCWLVVACDLPMLRAEAVDWLLGQRRPGRWAVLPRITPSRAEPLAALYEPESRMLLEKLVARGCRAPRQLVGDPAVHTPTPPPSLRECWANVNTPEELKRLAADRSKPPRGSGR